MCRRKNNRFHTTLYYTCGYTLYYTFFLQTFFFLVGHQRVHVEDNYPLLQCFKCLGFGQTSKRCQETKEKCVNCAEDHRSDACLIKDYIILVGSHKYLFEIHKFFLKNIMKLFLINPATYE